MIRSFLHATIHRRSRPRRSNRPRSFRPRFEQVEDRRLLAADLALDITDAEATVEPGGTIVYGFHYANVGDEAANGILYTKVPRGTSFNAEASHEGWTCEEGRGFWSGTQCSFDLGEVAAQSEGVLPFAVDVDSDISARTRGIYNSGFISGDQRRWDRNDLGGEWTPVEHRLHDLRLDLDSAVDEVVAGGTISYVLDYSNQGNEVASGATISMRIPAHTSFNADASSEGWACGEEGNCSLAVGELAPGAEGQATFTVTLGADVPANVRHVTAFASIADDGSGAADKSLRNNTGSERDRVVQQLPDLSVTIRDEDQRVAVGGTIVYTIDYANEGLLDSTGVTLSFDVPRNNTTFTPEGSTEGWVCEEGTCLLAVGDLAMNASGSATVAVTVDSEPLSFWSRRVYATVSIADDGSAGGEQSLRNNRDWESTHIVRNVPDLSLSLDDTDADALPGETIVYTVAYENRGVAEATGSVVKMRVPNGTSFTTESSTEGWACEDGICSLEVGTIAAGASGTATFAVVVDMDFSSRSRHVWGIASISDDGTHGRDENRRNNWSLERTKVSQPDPQLE